MNHKRVKDIDPSANNSFVIIFSPLESWILPSENGIDARRILTFISQRKTYSATYLANRPAFQTDRRLLRRKTRQKLLSGAGW